MMLSVFPYRAHGAELLSVRACPLCLLKPWQCLFYSRLSDHAHDAWCLCQIMPMMLSIVVISRPWCLVLFIRSCPCCYVLIIPCLWCFIHLPHNAMMLCLWPCLCSFHVLSHTAYECEIFDHNMLLSCCIIPWPRCVVVLTAHFHYNELI